MGLPAQAGRPRPGSPQERAMLLATLERTQENVTLAAQSLNVSRVTLYRMLRRHAIDLGRGLKELPMLSRTRRNAPATAADQSELA